MIWHTERGVDLGFLPGFLNETDPRSAKEQFDANYQHGGGWRPNKNFVLHKDNGLAYPGDTVLRPIATTTLRDELIIVYPFSWVLVKQLDGSYEVSRMD